MDHELEAFWSALLLLAACDGLVAAAAELIEESAGPEVAGHFYQPGDVIPRNGIFDDKLDSRVWTDMRPGVKGFNLG